MKKALSVFLMIAVAFGAFADEPVADVNVAEFSGNAAVQWGVDLDSGTTGFQNSYEVNLKLNLLNNGSKSTTGDGVWGELVLKVDGDTYAQWQNKTYGDTVFAPTKGMAGKTEGGDLTAFFKKVYVDVAKIHIGPVYIGIKSGDTQTGALKMDAAIRSADSDAAKWVNNAGPADYSQGIVLGYDSDMFKVDLDLRSKPGVENYQYTDNYAAALEGEFKGVENLSIKAGASYNFAKNSFDNSVKHNDGNGTSTAKGSNGVQIIEGVPVEHLLGYSASAGYKLGLNDTFYIRPQVGFAGAMGFTKDEIDGKTAKETYSGAEMAVGLLFGWGEIGEDKHAGVYYLDGDAAKKVSPGVGVVAYIPFASTWKDTFDGETIEKGKIYDGVAARIMPSFYSGEIVPGLTAAAYADIVIPKTGEDDVSDPKAQVEYARKEAATPMAFTFGAKYAIEAGEVTITPQAGVRFANAAYVAYEISDTELTDNKVFAGMGDQKKKTEVDEDGITSDGNYMNLKLGVDIAGLIDNTTLSVIWDTKNILNDTDYPDNTVGPKLGTLNFKAKIAL